MSMPKVKRKTHSFISKNTQIKTSSVENLKKIKNAVLGGRSSVLTSIWSGRVSENIKAFVGAATAGDYGRISSFTNFKGDEGLKFAGSGKGWTKEKAEISAIGEFFERYASGFINTSIEIATIKEMKGEYFIKANPYFTKEQFNQKGFIFKKISPKTKLSWVKMQNMVSEKKEWVPAIFCFFPFWGTEDDRHCLSTSTNGIAVHKTPIKAQVSAIFEILERDLLTNAWCSGTKFQQSEIPKDKRWDKFFENFIGEVFCVFPKNDFGIPFCILTLVFPAINGKSLMVSGSACGFTKKEAFSSALLEAFQGKKYLELEDGKTFTDSNFLDVQTFTDHCRFYTERNDLFSKIPLYDRKKEKKIFKENAVLSDEFDKNKLKYLINIFVQKKYPLYFHNLTTIDCKQLGISVWRAFCPNLSSLYGDEKFRYLGQPRIWNDEIFPEKISCNSIGKYNKYPHFLG